MGTDKRERQKANRQAKVEAERAAEARARRAQTIKTVVIAGVIIVLFMLVFSLASCSDQSDDAGKVDTTDEAAFKDGTGDDDTAPNTAEPSDDTAAANSADYGTGDCAPSEGVDTPVIDFDAAPKQCIDPSKRYTATIETTEGTVVLELDTERTPVTTNNFVNLARNGYYDDTVLFRTEAATGIIQGGSPHSQDNSDTGPGYTIPDEGQPFTSEDYAPGTIAMANTGQPDSASAQFFFLANEGGAYLGDTSAIGPSAGTYAVFGKATEGVDVLQAIAELDNGAGAPSKTVTIKTVTITES